MADWLGRHDVELVVLAGYMQLVSPGVPRSASPTASSTSTRRCCRPSPASTPSSRRSPTASRSSASPSTTSTRASTPAASSPSAPSSCRTRRRPRRSWQAIRPLEHELLGSGGANPLSRVGCRRVTQPGEVRIRRALLSVSDKTGIVDFARGLADLGVELDLHRRDGPRARGTTASRSRLDRRPHRLPRDHGRAGQDAAPEALRGPARAPRRPGAHGRRRGARDRVRRPRVREPVPVRGGRRAGAARPSTRSSRTSTSAARR